MQHAWRDHKPERMRVELEIRFVTSGWNDSLGKSLLIDYTSKTRKMEGISKKSSLVAATPFKISSIFHMIKKYVIQLIKRIFH